MASKLPEDVALPADQGDHLAIVSAFKERISLSLKQLRKIQLVISIKFAFA